MNAGAIEANDDDEDDAAARGGTAARVTAAKVTAATDGFTGEGRIAIGFVMDEGEQNVQDHDFEDGGNFESPECSKQKDLGHSSQHKSSPYSVQV